MANTIKPNLTANIVSIKGGFTKSDQLKPAPPSTGNNKSNPGDSSGKK